MSVPTAFDAEDWYPELVAEIDEAMTLEDIPSMDEIDFLVDTFAAYLADMPCAEEN